MILGVLGRGSGSFPSPTGLSGRPRSVSGDADVSGKRYEETNQKRQLARGLRSRGCQRSCLPRLAPRVYRCRMPSVPRRPRSHVLADEAVFEASRLLSRWVVREPTRGDYGVDAEIEIFDDGGEATGLTFKAQFKGTDSSMKQKVSVPVARTTQRYWSLLGVPVLMVLYVASEDLLLARWAHSYDPQAEGRNDPESETVSFGFTRENILSRARLPSLAEEVSILRQMAQRMLSDELPLKINPDGLQNLELDDRIELVDVLSRAVKKLPCGFRASADGDDLVCATLSLGPGLVRLSLPADAASFSLHHDLDMCSREDRREVAKSVPYAAAVTFAKLGFFSKAVAIYEDAPECDLQYEESVVEQMFDAYLELRRPDDAVPLAALYLLADQVEMRKKARAMLVPIVFETYGRMSSVSIGALLEILNMSIARVVEPREAANEAYTKAQILGSRGRTSEAISAFREAYAFDEDYLNRGYFLREVGGCYADLGQWDAAAACYNSAKHCSDRPDDIDFVHADALLHIGMYREAYEAARTESRDKIEYRDRMLLLQVITAFPIDNLRVSRQPRHQLTGEQYDRLPQYGTIDGFLRVLASTDVLDFRLLQRACLADFESGIIPAEIAFRMTLTIAWESLHVTRNWIPCLWIAINYGADDRVLQVIVNYLLRSDEPESVDDEIAAARSSLGHDAAQQLRGTINRFRLDADPYRPSQTVRLHDRQAGTFQSFEI